MTAPLTADPASRRQTLLVALVATLFVLALAYWFGWRPQSAKLAEASAQNRTAESQLIDLALVGDGASDGSTPEADSASGAREASEAHEAETLDAAVPPDPQLSTLLRQLDALAMTTGVRHASVVPSPLTASATGGAYGTISISAVGTRAAALDYLGRLVQLPRLVVVEHMSIQASPTDAEPDQVQLQLSARVFTTSP